MRDPNAPLINVDGTWNLDGYTADEIAEINSLVIRSEPIDLAELERRERITAAKRLLYFGTDLPWC